MRPIARYPMLLAGLLAAGPLAATGQVQPSGWSLDGPVPSPFGILGNSIANVHAAGDSVWIGPYLSLTTDEGFTWQVADADSLYGSSNRMYSIDIEGSVMWVGLGRSDVSQGDAVQTAAGFLVSKDGGRTFGYRFPQLDGPEDDTETYGANVLGALPVIVPQQSPPFDVDFDPRTQTVWVAGWASGIRRSADDGLTWRRVVLPPDDLDEISPDGTYDFRVEPQRGGTGELNHMGFSVLVDEEGVVWTGTPLGVNRSLDGGISWRRFGVDAAPAGLPGSWVISIEEEPAPGRNPVWVAAWNAGDAGGGGQFGVAVTRDGGASWEHTLQGQRIYDFAFGAGAVWAAGDEGLFLTRDGGRTWTSVRTFVDRDDPGRFVRFGASVYSVDFDGRALWVGTEDGLARSTDWGGTWSVFRVDVPLRPTVDDARAPRVDTFAYPNPFSPSVDRVVRIKFDAVRSGTVGVRIFDSSYNLVRRLEERRDVGMGEIAWDGTDDRGARVANGVVFYEVSGVVGASARGKILVIE